MIRVPVVEAADGDILTRAVVSPTDPGDMLLDSGSVLNPRVLRALRRMGVRSVWVECEGAEGVGEGADAVGRALRRCMGALADIVETVEKDGDGSPSADALLDGLHAFVAEVRRGPGVYVPLDRIYSSPAEIVFHSGDVCLLSVLLCRELLRAGGRTAEDGTLVQLGLAAILHDLGKAALPDEVRRRLPWERSRREEAVFRSHCLRGWEAVRRLAGESEAAVALWHHRAMDGSGYPDPSGEGAPSPPEQPPQAVRIAAVANAYCRLVGECEYLSIEALDEMRRAASRLYDGRVLEALCRVAPTFEPGVRVRLSSGHAGVVTAFDADRPFQPEVLLEADTDGSPLTGRDRVRLRLRDYPRIRVRSVSGRRVEHLQPDDAGAGWETDA